ncbi:unnamed protein product [Oikopleura dioica]|uniref:Laminin G domain-containing protein n=1 Tax=Oikopleura dioica TaxID=34765 RepID=E4WY27_OIKDI|nr:unnamed protein product [Oikopleura dioica]
MKISSVLLGTSFAGTLPNSCQGGKQLNLLAELISATPVSQRKGITLVRDWSPEFKKEVNGYRFDEEARLLSLRAAEALGNCSAFPSEGSLLLTIKPGRIDTKGQFLISLLERQARPHRPLFGLRLHYDTIYLDLPNVSHRNSPRVHVPNLHDGWWHSIFVTFAEGQIQVAVDCEVMTIHNRNDQAVKKLTSEVDLTRADFYLGSRRVPKQRFKVCSSLIIIQKNRGRRTAFVFIKYNISIVIKQL